MLIYQLVLRAINNLLLPQITIYEGAVFLCFDLDSENSGSYAWVTSNGSGVTAEPSVGRFSVTDGSITFTENNSTVGTGIFDGEILIVTAGGNVYSFVVAQ